jgi:hypothetical protein
LLFLSHAHRLGVSLAFDFNCTSNVAVTIKEIQSISRHVIVPLKSVKNRQSYFDERVQ